MSGWREYVETYLICLIDGHFRQVVRHMSEAENSEPSRAKHLEFARVIAREGVAASEMLVRIRQAPMGISADDLREGLRAWADAHADGRRRLVDNADEAASSLLEKIDHVG